MINRKVRPSIRLLLQLEEAKIGDPERLKEIKKSLEISKQIPESDNQYLQELADQLQKGIEQQVMEDWGKDYAQKLREKEKSYNETKEQELEKITQKEKSFEQILEPELVQNRHKIDKKFLKDTSNQLKEAVENQRKIQWTQDLIAKLKEKKIGDIDKLDHVDKLLKTGQAVEPSDIRYLKESARYIKQLAECKKKVTWTKYAIERLQESEMRHSKKLEEIREAVEQGKLVSQREIRYLNARYEKMLHALDQRNRIDWTIKTIEKLEESRVGDSKKLDEIKQLLEDDVPVTDDDVKYLREEYRLLRQILKIQRKTELAVGMIEELQEMEIGNSTRLEEIKQTIIQRRHVKESEINYLAQKYILLAASKKSENKYKINDKDLKEEVDYKSILADLNDAIIESENLPIKVSK